ncbi:NYN domain-containing protein [uncultured Pseudomonas sp.]|uniref:NYN domain-containing protein n=1 Tax=uncultured Pseudomonas sp. TaxID=114707 RepID=UPI0025F7D307|nr:NYN domain-containing protein [uncultured Pseudomonas sp.]
MRTIVYVDGFNLYYRALKGTGHKWLDLRKLCSLVLPKHCDVTAINFYTARISGKINPTSPRDQHLYLKALATLPGLTTHLGSFQVKDKMMFLSNPLSFQPQNRVAPIPLPRFANVVKSEEKGSDVNLGVHLVRDALMGRFDHAVVITNDTDLAEPLRIVVQDAKLPLTLLSPVAKPAQSLRELATHVRYLQGHLGGAQFPDPVLDQNGVEIRKPAGW